MESLHFPGKSPLTAINEIVKQIVTCNNLDGVATAPQDCFRRVRRFNPNFKDGMVLDKYQSQVVDMMARAPGGVKSPPRRVQHYIHSRKVQD